MGYLAHILWAAWGLHPRPIEPQWFWPIWIGTTAVALICTTSVIGVIPGRVSLTERPINFTLFRRIASADAVGVTIALVAL
jgi:hypothetical protein